MKRLVAIGVVAAAIVIAAVLALRPGAPPADPNAHPQLDQLLVQCDAGGSSLATMYTAVSEPARKFVAVEPSRALAVVRGQVANVIDGRLAVCERALAVAQHDKRGSAVTAIGPFVERLKLAHDTLMQLIAALAAGSAGAAASLDALDAAMR